MKIPKYKNDGRYLYGLEQHLKAKQRAKLYWEVIKQIDNK